MKKVYFILISILLVITIGCAPKMRIYNPYNYLLKDFIEIISMTNCTEYTITINDTVFDILDLGAYSATEYQTVKTKNQYNTIFASYTIGGVQITNTDYTYQQLKAGCNYQISWDYLNYPEAVILKVNEF